MWYLTRLHGIRKRAKDSILSADFWSYAILVTRSESTGWSMRIQGDVLVRFLELLPLTDSDRPKSLGDRFTTQIRFTDYSCGAMKINCAIDRLPQVGVTRLVRSTLEANSGLTDS